MTSCARRRLGPLHRPEATLIELVETFLEQYSGAPASNEWLQYYLGKSTAAFGERPISELESLEIARWRSQFPETTRHAHRALRQVLGAAVRWRWIEHNVAADVRNPEHVREEFLPFDSWEEVDAVAHELGPFRPLVIFYVGTGVRPEEAFGADWDDVDLEARVLTVRRAFAKARLKPYPKTVRSRRRVPLRSKVVDALEELPRRHSVLFPNSVGGRIEINNWRSREWAPALEAAGVEHCRIYDMRHTFATWSLAAGMSIFTLARRMGTSVLMIDRTYGHLARDAEEHDRGLLEAFDATDRARGHVVGTKIMDDDRNERADGVREDAALQRLCG
jgi:integrase